MDTWQRGWEKHERGRGKATNQSRPCLCTYFSADPKALERELDWCADYFPSTWGSVKGEAGRRRKAGRHASSSGSSSADNGCFECDTAADPVIGARRAALDASARRRGSILSMRAGNGEPASPAPRRGSILSMRAAKLVENGPDEPPLPRQQSQQKKHGTSPSRRDHLTSDRDTMAQLRSAVLSEQRESVYKRSQLSQQGEERRDVSSLPMLRRASSVSSCSSLLPSQPTPREPGYLVPPGRSLVSFNLAASPSQRRSAGSSSSGGSPSPGGRAGAARSPPIVLVPLIA
jgi:hypothetical protein